MTRRKRTPSPDRSRKRVAFNIPASLQQLSALSRSLAIHHGAIQETENSSIIARAQALSQSPTADAGWQQNLKPQQAKEIRFKHDSRQFPDQQAWPQPTPNQGAVGHARFLEKQWQASQAAENIRRAQFMQQQMEENRQRMQNQSSTESTVTTLATISTDMPKQKPIEFVSKHQREFSDGQIWPKTIPRNPKRQIDVDIEQRRQAIIAKLMESKPASIATSSSNIQIPTNSTPQPALGRPEQPAEEESPLDMMTQPHQIAALVERKRAENASNGSLNRWLAAQAGHQSFQEEAQKANSASPATVGQGGTRGSPENLFVFKPHPSNLAAQVAAASDTGNGTKENHVSAQEYESAQELDLRSLFSSPAPTPQPTPSQRQTVFHNRGGENFTSKDDPTQLPSPSLSSPSQHEVRRAPSPSAQLLMNLANAAPAPSSQAPHHSSFRTPSLTVSTEGLIRTSSAARQRPPTSRESVSVDNSLTPQQQELRLMQRQTEQQRQEHNLRHYQQIQAQYSQTQSEQPMRRPQSSASMTSNSSGYYKIKPHLWDAFSTDKFAMSPPSYVQNSTSNVLGSNISSSNAGYAMTSIEGLDNSTMYSRPRGAGYGSFASGGGANANFRMSTQNNFGVPKR